MEFPQELELLIESFARLPGVGKRTAQRFALHMMKWPEYEKKQFSQRIADLEQIQKCENCLIFTEHQQSLCSICLHRERGISPSLCVVEGFQDMLSIERSQKYKGLYHLLGGTLNPLLGIGPEQLTIDLLLKRLEGGQFTEIILALNPSLEGDATSAYLADFIPPGITLVKLGLGIPVGGSLEYLDPQTVSSALQYRHQMRDSSSNSTIQ